MFVSVHEVTEAKIKCFHHWADKGDIAFFATLVTLKTSKGDVQFQLFSNKPIKFATPEIEVVND